MANRFPLFHLGTLLARQLSTPIATKIKLYARTNPRFKRSVCMRTGRVFHECELRCRMWSLALRQPRKLPPISDAAALEAGANILGEMAVFGLGGLIVILEVNRQANKQDEKELDQASRWLALLVSLEELQRELELQQQDIDRLQGTLRRIAPRYFPRTDPLTPAPSPAPAEPNKSPSFSPVISSTTSPLPPTLRSPAPPEATPIPPATLSTPAHSHPSSSAQPNSPSPPPPREC